MKRAPACLVVLVAVSMANPTMQWIQIGEFQTAPPEYQRIELQSMLYPNEYPFELGGSLITTNAGTAVVDSGVFFDTLCYIVVLDSMNTTGTFRLGDDSDYIRIHVPFHNDSFLLELRYPANPYFDGSWAPPPGASASLYGNMWGGHWYIDLSPTFRAFNDDGGGGIWGVVFDRNSAIDGATVRIKSALGYGTAIVQTYHDSTQGSGYFHLKPTGPGRFVVTVECEGYLPYTVPETIELAVNEERWLNIMLERAGVTEEGLDDAIPPELRQRGRALVLTGGRPGKALLRVYDNLGRVRMSEKVALVAGSNELALPGLSSGVFFASCRSGRRTLKTKLVLY